jgi:hypothetical protein
MVQFAYVIESLVIGLFCVAIYAGILYTFPYIAKYMEHRRIAVRLFGLIFVLFVFGFYKHVVEFYGVVWTGYCKARENCYTPSIATTEISLKSAEQYFVYAKNVYVDAFWEGVLFTCVGLPFALTLNNGYIVAFLTGVLSHILAEWIGFNDDICKTNCIPDSSH